VFDLYIYPFGIHNKEEYSDLSGYFAGNVHRRANRTRVEDLIVIRFAANRSLSEDEKNSINDFVSKTGEHYFRTKGPITTAAKNACDFFNNLLNQINVKNNEKTPILGSFHLVVLNKDDLYLVQAGGAKSFYLSRTKFERFEDKSYGMDGIGISKSLNLRFFHAKVAESDRLIITSKPPQTWTKEALNVNNKLSISHLRRRILELSSINFEAVIVQFRIGNGSVHQLKLDSNEFSQIEQDDEFPSDQTEPSEEFSSPIIAEDIEPNLKVDPHQIEKQNPPVNVQIAPNLFDFFPETDLDGKKTENLDQLSNKQKPTAVQNEDQFKEEPHHEIETNLTNEGIFLSGDVWEAENKQSLNDKNTKKLKDKQRDSKGFAIFLLKTRNHFQQINNKYGVFRNSLNRKLAKLLKSPSRTGDLADSNALSSTSMLMIAILVALFVSAIGITVYLQSGIGSQQAQLIADANMLISDALEEPDAGNQLLMYQEALRLVEESENFGKSESATELKTFLQSQLDIIQGVTRIDIQPTIFGGLDKRIQISRMGIHSNGDVYALDSGTGRVIRMIATRPDYVIDTSFVCGPGKYGDVIVEPLVDIEVVDFANEINTSLMGIDSRGDLILCIPGSDPIAIALEKSDITWGNIKALSFNGFSLYVLDIGETTRDIYRYRSNNFAFDQIPESIFSGNIPENLADSRDISVNQEELFLLHNDSQLTRCNLNQASCENNIGYGVIVNDKTRENLSVLPNVDFSQIYLTYPPDPSIYILNDNNQTIYHFSLAVNLQKQISPNLTGLQNFNSETNSLTAFAVSPNGIIHFAYGNLVYFGYLP